MVMTQIKDKIRTNFSFSHSPRLRSSFSQDGFTLIESVVAMGLFAGVVFLLITVFNGFMLDDFPSKSDRALSLAEEEIARIVEDRDFTSSERDTLSFHITHDMTFENGLVEVVVTVGSSKKPFRVYTKLTDLCAIQ